MSDRVTITVHRRNADGTWPPGEEPPKRQTILAARKRMCDTEMMLGFVDGRRFIETRTDFHYNCSEIIAWADVTEVLR